VNANPNLLPTPSEGLRMKSVFPLDVHRLRGFYKTKHEVAVNVQTQPSKAEDTESNEIDLRSKKPPMAGGKFRFLVAIGTLATITTDQKEFL
jgi:hypothetical protein